MFNIIFLAKIRYRTQYLFVIFYLIAIYINALNIFVKLNWTMNMNLFIILCTSRVYLFYLSCL